MTATKDQPTSVHARVLRVVADLPAIGKDSLNCPPRHEVQVPGIEDVIRVLRPLLAEHGVHLVPAHRVVDDQRWETTQGNRSTRHRHVTLETTWTVWGADGDSFEAVTVSEGKDSADKALNKAMTASLKYAVLQKCSPWPTATTTGTATRACTTMATSARSRPVERAGWAQG